MSWVPYPWFEKVKTLMKGEGVDFLPPDIKSTPVLIRELVGHPLRVFKPGDVGTMDYVPKRVNIKVDASGFIEDITFG